ncbi:MAG: hypothetical protein DWH82_07080 [Planctomycetota bacterium]|nr:MAG: hypothetical protein DWH82_07080 [Planctomycetota bacterium]
MDPNVRTFGFFACFARADESPRPDCAGPSINTTLAAWPLCQRQIFRLFLREKPAVFCGCGQPSGVSFSPTGGPARGLVT